jgi:hypothetical protein
VLYLTEVYFLNKTEERKMPVLIIYGIPEHYPVHVLQSLKKNLSLAVSSVYELGLTSDDVSIFFPKELDQPVTGKEIIVFIDGLFNKRRRTQEVKDALAMKVGIEIKNIFNRSLVEVFVRGFDPAQGFWTSESEEKTNHSDCPSYGSIDHMTSVTGRCPDCGEK